jgi:hypothetical protein
MLVVVLAIPDIPEWMQGDKSIMVCVYEDGDLNPEEGKTFPCLEMAENWVYGRWPSIKEQPRMDPPVKVDGCYYDDPEVRWVGVVNV